MRRLSNALRALTRWPSNRAASPVYWRIATGISWVSPTAPASLTAFGLPLDSCTTTARSNAGSIPTRRPAAFTSRAKGWPCDTLLITRASASLSPACAVSAPESRSATVSDLPERLSMPPRAALVPKRQFRDRPVIRQPPRAVRATCPCPPWHASAECHRAAYARSACEHPRRRQAASCSRVRTERNEVRASVKIATVYFDPEIHRALAEILRIDVLLHARASGAWHRLATEVVLKEGLSARCSQYLRASPGHNPRLSERRGDLPV